MVSVEIEALNEKPRAGVGAGFLIESGVLSLRANSPRTWWLANKKYEYKQRRLGAGRGRRQVVGGGVAMQHEIEITISARMVSTLSGLLLVGAGRRSVAAAWLPMQPSAAPEYPLRHGMACAKCGAFCVFWKNISNLMIGSRCFPRFR